MNLTKFLFIITVLFWVHSQAFAQNRFFSKTGTISFFSKTDMEDISAVNKLVTVVLDTKTAAVQLSVPMKAFGFERALMQEHFNENYVESDKFPTSTFKGKITNNTSINYNLPGSYEALVEGELMIHGVARPITTKGTVIVEQQGLQLQTTFTIRPEDYKITIPALVADKIAKSVMITMKARLESLNR